MNRWVVSVFLVAGYCIPYVFLALFGDLRYGTVLLYAAMLAGFSALLICAVKTKQFFAVIIGNGISTLSSLVFVHTCIPDDFSWYFKPFTPASLTWTVSIAVFVIQLLYLLRARKRPECR